jgi:uncharacterized protein YjbI with pentapeptide repeats
MIVCPRCSYENEDSAMNCASCRINLQWALENLQEAARHNLERVEGPPPEAQAGNRVARGFLVIALLLAIPASGFLAFWNWLHGVLPPNSAQSGGYLAVAGFWLVVAVVCIPAAIVVLLRRQPKPNLLPGLRILALIGVTGGLLFGLMRLTLVILPEHTGQSLIIQYKLGERDFRGANLEQAELSEANLHEGNLSGADLRGANLAGAQLYRTDLSGANLRGANLRGANLFEADLREADLREADLTGARVHWAHLRGADLREADLTDAFLYRIILPGADLRGANLSGADLREADLTGANLRAAYLSGADLSGAAVTNEQLDRASNLEGTILPDGSVHE